MYIDPLGRGATMGLSVADMRRPAPLSGCVCGLSRVTLIGPVSDDDATT